MAVPFISLSDTYMNMTCLRWRLEETKVAKLPRAVKPKIGPQRNILVALQEAEYTDTNNEVGKTDEVIYSVQEADCLITFMNNIKTKMKSEAGYRGKLVGMPPIVKWDIETK